MKKWKCDFCQIESDWQPDTHHLSQPDKWMSMEVKGAVGYANFSHKLLCCPECADKARAKIGVPVEPPKKPFNLITELAQEYFREFVIEVIQDNQG